MENKNEMNRELGWKELKALNDVYTLRKSQAKIQKHPYIIHLFEEKGILDHKLGNPKVIIPTDKFDAFYKKNLKENFSHYKKFLEGEGLETDARKNYNEFDIRSLLFISDNRTQIIPNLTTIRAFSGEFFKGKGSKYLEDKKSVKDAVHKILGISHFPEFDEKEGQWRFVVDCPNPNAVVLCENLNFLKLPWHAEKHSIKLWYVGGNNIRIIDQIDREEFKRPFFYSGDWDLAGLKIYSRIRKKLEANNKEIILLHPNNPDNRLPVDSPNHKSKWDFNKEFSGLEKNYFNETEIKLIKNLIANNEWIEEESNNLIEMINQII